jgi:hypothetical protein
MTEQEFRNQLEKVLNAVQDQGLIKPGLLLTEHNSIHIISGAMAIYVRTNQVPTVSEMARYINDLGDIEVFNPAKGRVGFLQYHHGVQNAAVAMAAPPDPRLSIPHRDKWPLIDTKMKWITHTQNVKIPVPHQAAWNELGAYLQNHPELRGSATEAKAMTFSGVPIDEQNAIRGFSTKTQDAVLNEQTPPGHVRVARHEGDYATAHAEINALTIADIKTTHTSTGRYERLTQIQASLHRRATEMATYSSGPAVLSWVREQIKNYGSSSIR